MEQLQIGSSNMGPTFQYCCVILNQLKKHLCVLYEEAHLAQNVEDEFTHKQNAFFECNSSINNKLLYLWALADQQPQDGRRKNMQHFLVQLTTNWKETEEKLAQECASVPVFSRTTPNVLLSTILEKMQYVADSTKFTFQTITAHFMCSRNAAFLYNEIMCVVARLSGSITALHYSMLLSKLVPYLRQLDATLEVVARTGHCDVKQVPAAHSGEGDDQKEVPPPPAVPPPSAPPATTASATPAAPHIPRDPVYSVDGRSGPPCWQPVRPAMGCGPALFGTPIRLQRLLRPLGPWGGPLAAQHHQTGLQHQQQQQQSAAQQQPAQGQSPTSSDSQTTPVVKTEPPDSDGQPKQERRARCREEECDLPPIKMPRLESGLLAPLP